MLTQMLKWMRITWETFRNEWEIVEDELLNYFWEGIESNEWVPIDTDSQYLALQIYQMVQGDDEVECVEEIVNETESFCRPVLIIGDGGVCRYRPPVPPPPEREFLFLYRHQSWMMRNVAGAESMKKAPEDFFSVRPQQCRGKVHVKCRRRPWTWSFLQATLDLRYFIWKWKMVRMFFHDN